MYEKLLNLYSSVPALTSTGTTNYTDINDIYTPLEEAKIELERRWKDVELKKKIEKYLDNNIPSIFLDEPRGICTFNIASPNWAFFNFYKQTKTIGVKPVVFEYTDDIFVTTNFDKVSYAKMIFYHGKDHRGNMVTSHKHVIDLTGKNERRKIREIKTLWGESFVDFHHRAISEFYGEIDIYDGSDWYHKMGKTPKEYYRYILALYIRNGVLFDNFLMNNSEESFTKNVLIPAFEFVKKEFGLKPLIVPMVPKDKEENIYWWCYPEFIEMIISKRK